MTDQPSGCRAPAAPADPSPCGEPPEVGAPLPLCSAHLLAAHDWVAREVGTRDLLERPCLACGGAVGVRYPSGTICADCDWRVGEVPDGDLAPPRLDVVYYVRWREQIKIGTSANPRQRLASIPHDEVLAFEPGGRAVEQRRHAQFAAERFAGTEWFAVHDSLLEHVLALRLGIDDPWAEYERWVSRRVAARG